MTDQIKQLDERLAKLNATISRRQLDIDRIEERLAQQKRMLQVLNTPNNTAQKRYLALQRKLNESKIYNLPE